METKRATVNRPGGNRLEIGGAYTEFMRQRFAHDLVDHVFANLSCAAVIFEVEDQGQNACYTEMDTTKIKKGEIMFKRIMLATATSVFLLLSVAAHAEPISVVFYCELKDGSTKEDAMEINARWLKWARATGASDKITSSFVSTLIGDLGGFMWVDTYPDIATWGKVADADSNFDAEFDEITTCSKSRMIRGEETVPAR